ncbi:helix-turn-helix transcriptional regulator [Brevibacterium spongiae]|uniref:Helix-turn-helix domain-containing protein n=1 Tax=Brevibacterium spongiae TaxID=2909672 RepID=A0ABY5ST72_9MICO|nr:helix-turn-helix domain-containing protein [Brevibacterium spongiae]UVI37768.1 helix-turn-helix domain-containing protein [Brevibacterium spongiae]
MDTRPKPRSDSPTRPASTSAGGRRRSDILRLLRERTSATAVELAEGLDVHPNTVRFHLGILERDGEVLREAQSAGTPGRPEVRYFAPPASEPGPRRADLLAEILLARIASSANPAAEAVDAGYQWGTGEAARAQRRGSSAVDGLIDALRESGFGPTLEDRTQIDLHNCPLREFLSAHGRLVCAVHSGMMTGFLDGAGSSQTVDSLEAFATPTSCRARLRRR